MGTLEPAGVPGESEEINFDNGKIAFKKASYNQKGYLFIQGPSDDEWAASDHWENAASRFKTEG